MQQIESFYFRTTTLKLFFYINENYFFALFYLQQNDRTNAIVCTKFKFTFFAYDFLNKNIFNFVGIKCL